MKIILIGSVAVGKTNIFSIFANPTKPFDPYGTVSTFSVEFFSRRWKIDDRLIEMQLWDTAGQERYESITSQYFRPAHAAIIVYDVNAGDSFAQVEKWIKLFHTNCQQERSHQCLYLIGNKVDLPEKMRIVSTAQGKMCAARNNIPLFFEVSVLNPTTVHEALEMICEDIYTKHSSALQAKPKGETNPLDKTITTLEPVKDEKSSCCFSSS